MNRNDVQAEGGLFEPDYRIAQLISAFLEGRLSPADRAELDDWIAASEENLLLFEEMTDEENIASSLRYFRDLEKEKAREKTWAKIRDNEKRGLWNRGGLIALAASLLIFIAAAWLLWKPKSSPSAPIATTDTPAPSKAKGQVVLTLGSGRQMSLAADSLLQEGGARIKNEKGLLVYQSTGGATPQWNDIATARGATYALQLSDGSRVWLNAASSLHYPTAFTGAERVVELKGEAYFEIAKDRTKPFRVKSGQTVVEVLGTHFNIKAYEGEAEQATTLIEGSVRLASGNASQLLQPGQQALVRGDKVQVRPADIESVLGWKEGLFYFRDATIEEVGAQLQRWYDVEVIYKDAIRHHFNGPVPRNQSIEKTIAMLEGPNRVHFTLEGKKLIVTK